MDIINCSYLYTNNKKDPATGIYTENYSGYKIAIDGLYDYYVSAHFITIVVSSGNITTDNTDSRYNPYGKISSQAYAYNVITVGGLMQDRESAAQGLNIWKHHTNAAYITENGDETKPNISAPYKVTVPGAGENGNDVVCNGTSYSAPIVAGCIALLMESNIDYCIFPEVISSTVMATATKNKGYDNDIYPDNYLNIKTGAGVINLEAMLNCDFSLSKDTFLQETLEDECVSITSPFDFTHTDNWGNLLTFDIELDYNDSITLSLAWCVPTKAASGGKWEPCCTNYDMYIFAPGDYTSNDDFGVTLPIAESVTEVYNNEFIRITAPETGTYTVVIWQYGDMDPTVTREYLAFAYHIS